MNNENLCKEIKIESAYDVEIGKIFDDEVMNSIKNGDVHKTEDGQFIFGKITEQEKLAHGVVDLQQFGTIDENGNLQCLGHIPIVDECIKSGVFGWQEMKVGTGQIFKLNSEYCNV